MGKMPGAKQNKPLGNLTGILMWFHQSQIDNNRIGGFVRN
jgi:hypothetical protein